MSDSTVFNAGQSLRRREMMKAAVVGAVGVTAGAASSGTVEADEFDPEDATWRDGAAVRPFVFAYEAISAFDFLSDGDYVSREDAEQMQFNNLHTTVYYGLQSVRTHAVETFLTDVENQVQPGDPEDGPLANMIWSDATGIMYEEVQAGESSVDVQSAATEVVEDSWSERMKNVLENWNQVALDWNHYQIRVGKVVEEQDGSYHHIYSAASSDNSNASSLDIDPIPDSVEDVTPVAEVTLPNGDTKEVKYAIFRRHNDTSVDTSENHRFVAPIESLSDEYPFDVTYDPDEDSDYEFMSPQWRTSNLSVYAPDSELDDLTVSDSQQEWVDILEALYNGFTSQRSQIIDTVGEVVDRYSSGDLTTDQIMTPSRIYEQYSDSDSMTRTHAELIGMGFAAPEEDATLVTLSDEDDVDNAQGHLFVQWNWDLLSPWEYDDELEDYELTIEDAEPEATYEIELEDAGSVTVTAPDDIDSGDSWTVDLEDDADDPDEAVKSVAVDADGELTTTLPEGVTVPDENYDSAVLATVNEEEDTSSTEFLSGDLEVHAVDNDDGELSLTGYSSRSIDPDRTIEDVERLTKEGYVHVDDLDSVAVGGGGGGGDSNTLLIGGMVLALVGMILAALMGDS